MHELTQRDRDILAFEDAHARSSGAKDGAIRAEFGMSAARYYQLVNTLIDRPEALQAEPMLVARLRRMRRDRVRKRSLRIP